MNVKSVTPNLVPLEGVVKNDSAERVRFQDTADRDANGKQEHSQKEEESHRFSEEDWQEAIEKLKKLSSVEKNNLKVVDFSEGERRFVKFLSPTDEVIRRLNENEVWLALKNADLETPKGQLLDKAL